MGDCGVPWGLRHPMVQSVLPMGREDPWVTSNNYLLARGAQL